jgi:hypothetical protein
VLRQGCSHTLNGDEEQFGLLIKERGEYLKAIMIRRTDGSEWLDEDTATALKVKQELERKPLLACRHTSGKD